MGDEKQLDAVDAGKPFAQLWEAGMETAVMDQILRQRDPELKAAVEATVAGDIREAFAKLGRNIAEVKAANLAGAAAARSLKLEPGERGRTGVMAPTHELRAEKALHSSYAPGDLVAFHRSYKRIGVQKGEESRVERWIGKAALCIWRAPAGKPWPGIPGRSAAAAAEPRCTARSRWNCGRATASAVPATTKPWAW